MTQDLQEIKGMSLKTKVSSHNCRLLPKDIRIATYRSKLTIPSLEIKMKACKENIQSNQNQFQTALKVPRKSQNDFRA